MSLIKWHGGVDDAFPTLPSLLEDFFGKGGDERHFMSGVRLPAVNIKEEDDKFVISLAIPGVSKEDCKIEVENGMLTVSASTKSEKRDEEKGKYSRYEYSVSSFSRSFSLPTNADAEHIAAKYDNGELKITLPKKEKSLPEGREITIE